jgi:hypothetical protein
MGGKGVASGMTALSKFTYCVYLFSSIFCLTDKSKTDS